MNQNIGILFNHKGGMDGRVLNGGGGGSGPVLSYGAIEGGMAWSWTEGG